MANLNDAPTFFKPADISAAQEQGYDLRDNPQNALPPLAGLGQPPDANDRDVLTAALLGMSKSVGAAQEAAKTGSPIAAALAGIAGAAGQASPQQVALQRQQMQNQAMLQQFSAMPVEAFSPALAQAHPELKGLPLGVVEQISPILGRYQQMASQFYTADQAAQLMSPTQNPADIAATKASLQKLYPSGMVPKDYAHVAATNSRFGAGQATKVSEADQKRLTALGDALDPSKARQGAFGVSKQVFDRAERLQSLAGAYKDGNLDSRQMEELAIGLNSMLSGANVGAAEQVKALVPNTIIGNASKMAEWLTNNPQGTNQQAFVQRMLASVQREKDTASQQILRTQMQRIARYADLEKKSPDEFYNVLQSAGIEPADYQKWKAGGFKAISAVQSPEASPSIPTVSDQASYDALPRGSQYMGPDGSMRIKR